MNNVSHNTKITWLHLVPSGSRNRLPYLVPVPFRGTEPSKELSRVFISVTRNQVRVKIRPTSLSSHTYPHEDQAHHDQNYRNDEERNVVTAPSAVESGRVEHGDDHRHYDAAHQRDHHGRRLVGSAVACATNQLRDSASRNCRRDHHPSHFVHATSITPIAGGAP